MFLPDCKPGFQHLASHKEEQVPYSPCKFIQCFKKNLCKNIAYRSRIRNFLRGIKGNCIQIEGRTCAKEKDEWNSVPIQRATSNSVISL